VRLTWRHHHRLVKTLRVMEARPAETPAQASDMKLSFGFAGLTFAPAATGVFSLHFFSQKRRPGAAKSTPMAAMG